MLSDCTVLRTSEFLDTHTFQTNQKHRISYSGLRLSMLPTLLFRASMYTAGARWSTLRHWKARSSIRYWILHRYDSGETFCAPLWNSGGCIPLKKQRLHPVGKNDRKRIWPTTLYKLWILHTLHPTHNPQSNTYHEVCTYPELSTYPKTCAYIWHTHTRKLHLLQ